jgi:hypothetical protein
MIMKAADACNNIESLWNQASEQPVMIENGGKAIAIVLSVEVYNRLVTAQSPRQVGCGHHLLSEAGVNVNELLEIPTDDLFSEYMPNGFIIAGEVEVAADHLDLRRAREPREGWEEHYKQMVEEGQDKLLDAESLTPTRWDLMEWVW